jgi:hypothetical protein
MRRAEEEEEFAMATNRLKSIKSATALRAVSRLKEEEEDESFDVRIGSLFLRTFYKCINIPFCTTASSINFQAL